MLPIPTSDVQPLPHQIRAVYGALLPALRCGFCSPTTPAPGKAIMAGLYIKELILRDDVRRSLIVAPGGLARRIIEAGCTPVVVNPSKNSRSAELNVTGRFFCEGMPTVLTGRGEGEVCHPQPRNETGRN